MALVLASSPLVGLSPPSSPQPVVAGAHLLLARYWLGPLSRARRRPGPLPKLTPISSRPSSPLVGPLQLAAAPRLAACPHPANRALRHHPAPDACCAAAPPARSSACHPSSSPCGVMPASSTSCWLPRPVRTRPARRTAGRARARTRRPSRLASCCAYALARTGRTV